MYIENKDQIAKYKKYAINDLHREIKKQITTIDILESVDFDKPCNEETWHKISKLSFEYNNFLLVHLCSKIFPEAEDVECCRWYVEFKLHGFQCYLPMNNNNCIMVNMSWYKENRNDIDERLFDLHNKLIPELKKFTKDVRSYASALEMMTKSFTDSQLDKLLQDDYTSDIKSEAEKDNPSEQDEYENLQ